MLTEWTHNPQTDTYLVTGVTVDNKRFKLAYANPHQALCVNLWNGSVWLVRNGRRTLVKRVHN